MTFRCDRCEGAMVVQGQAHLDPMSCVRSLRKRLQLQKKLAESLSFEISVRYLAVLEELAQNPGDQVGFFTIGSNGTKIRHAPAQVAGIFAAILMRYRESCDWTPLHDARRRIEELEAENAELRLRAAPPPDPSGS